MKLARTHFAARPASLQRLSISTHIIFGHSCGGEPVFKPPPYSTPIVRQDLGQRRDSFFLAADNLAGGAVVDDLWDRPTAEREHRCAARHCFDHRETKWL